MKAARKKREMDVRRAEWMQTGVVEGPMSRVTVGEERNVKEEGRNDDIIRDGMAAEVIVG